MYLITNSEKERLTQDAKSSNVMVSVIAIDDTLASKWANQWLVRLAVNDTVNFVWLANDSVNFKIQLFLLHHISKESYQGELPSLCLPHQRNYSIWRKKIHNTKTSLIKFSLSLRTVCTWEKKFWNIFII